MEIWLRAYTSPNTRDAYNRDVGRWFTWCHDYDIADSRRGDVDAYRAELDDHDPPLAARTRRRRLAAIPSFSTYWLIEDVVPRNPAAHVRRPRQPRSPQHDPPLDHLGHPRQVTAWARLLVPATGVAVGGIITGGAAIWGQVLTHRGTYERERGARRDAFKVKRYEIDSAQITRLG
ncbi:site-specific integrase [Actinomadura chibensis]|uniref:Core-binding (CB) domain-containing protein n=1 Tax=Actinomadura chibensis TaxID=392828 RepID=A0A5D0NU42_9ACTN|nr:site-specific integrase [Actinomadura chibensis]TYB47887.1 hypothetical protein FXF69_01165 [Actinomadura chibensis]